MIFQRAPVFESWVHGSSHQKAAILITALDPAPLDCGSMGDDSDRRLSFSSNDVAEIFKAMHF